MVRRTLPKGVRDAAGSIDLFDVPLSDAASDASRAPIGAEGHRNRMRIRLLTVGPDSLADHEMLEMLLFLALPRRDTKPIARMLLSRFGGFGQVISASPDALRATEGLGDAGIAALKLAQGAAIRLLRGELVDRPVLRSWETLTNYLLASLRHETIEQFQVLFLDARTRLISAETMARGTINHAPVYPREIARRALELHATSVVLVHNHPSGTPTPSREDVAMTRDILRALHPLGIAVQDHLIVAGDQCVSMKRLNLLE